MRERGKYQLQLMKTRSSSGVGMKIDLDFDINTLRITNSEDQSDDTDTGQPQTRSSGILNSIRRQSTVETLESLEPTQGAGVARVPARVESTKLRQLLGNMSDDAPF